MQHAIHVSALLLLAGIALIKPTYTYHATVAAALVMGSWFYFSLRRPDRTRRDGWYAAALAGATLCILVLFEVNAVTDDRHTVQGAVTNWMSSTQRLTGHTGIVCSAELENGVVENFPAAVLLAPGSIVPFHRYSRRVIGYHYEYAGRK